MEPIERRDDRQGGSAGGGVGDAGGSDASLGQLRARGDAFVAASEEAIRRALSSNSEAFLRATLQRGGQ